jgi:beta-1,2-mannobiose phosphorylase / 1,2-beta-oligomannan phosphorylase
MSRLVFPSARVLLFSAICQLGVAAAIGQQAPTAEEFPRELVSFTPYAGNPVFAATGQDTWDRKIRERGYILREGDTWYLWYTGYSPQRFDTEMLGLATSEDGFRWTRWPGNPIVDRGWVEDMCVVKQGDTYYMFAEGRDDIAHWLTSKDRVHWEEHGPLDVRLADGRKIPPGPYGTPTVWVEDGTWNLFYERGDRGVWLARSKDHLVWTNVVDEPVIARGPEAYDRQMVALNQVIKYQGHYYGVYHALAAGERTNWTTCVAASSDLVHWKKYPANPIVSGDKSSGVYVFDGRQYRLYTMHPEVRVYLPKAK